MRRALLALLAVSLLMPATAEAGNVFRTDAQITYDADPPTDQNEVVTATVESGKVVLTSERGAATADCSSTDPTIAECDPAPLLVVNFLEFGDSFTGVALPATIVAEVHGGDGVDEMTGGNAADRLFGDAADDRLVGGPGNDALDGGPANDYLYGEDGDDSAVGGAGDDNWTPGPGRDTFAGGDGVDVVTYAERTDPVTVTLDAAADDGVAGEGDNAGADVESAIGGSGADRIVGNEVGNSLDGGAGNDQIVAGGSEDLVIGAEGDDTIDTRDGGYDTVLCGPGNDTVLADPGDSTTECEQAPDPDGDGYLADTDCAPADPAINPGAGEVFGNAIDEDCSGAPGYERIFDTLSFKFKTKKAPKRLRFSPFTIADLQAGDTVQVRCSGGKKKKCPFKSRTRTATGTTINLAKVLKNRYLRPGATIEIRHLRPNFIGKVVRIKVRKNLSVKSTQQCLPPGATTPTSCA